MDIFLITCVKQWRFTNIKMLDFMEATFSHLEPDITHTNNNINMVIWVVASIRREITWCFIRE